MALNAPSNINLTSTELGKVTITFDTVTSATHYKIERSESLNNGFSTLTDYLTTTTYDDIGLDDVKLYFYKISASSDGITFGTPTKLGVVTKPTISNIQGAPVNKKINLTWDGISVKYDIYRKDSGTYSSIATDNLVKTYSDSGLTNGTAYTYKIKGKEKEVSFTVDKTKTFIDEILKMTTSDANNTNKWSWTNKSNLTLQYKGQQAKMFSYDDWLFYGWPWARNTSGTLQEYRDSSLSGWKLSGSNYSSRSSYSAGSEKGVALYIPTIKWEDKLVSYGGIIDINRGDLQQFFTDEIYILDISKCVNESTTNHNGFSDVKIVGSSGSPGDKSYKLAQSGAGQPKVGTNVVKRSAYGASVIGNTMWVIGGYSLGDNSFTQSRIDRKNIGSTASLANSNKDHREVYDKINQIDLSTGVWGTEYDILDTAAGGAGTSTVNRHFINRKYDDGTGSTTATTSPTTTTNVNSHQNADKLTASYHGGVVIHNNKVYFTTNTNLYRTDLLTLNSDIVNLGTNVGKPNTTTSILNDPPGTGEETKHMLLVGDNIYTQTKNASVGGIYKYNITTGTHSILFDQSSGGDNRGSGFGMTLDRTGEYIYSAWQKGSWNGKRIIIKKIKLSDGSEDNNFNYTISQDLQEGRGLWRVGNYLYLLVKTPTVIVKIDIANKTSAYWVGQHEAGGQGDVNGVGTAAKLSHPQGGCIGPNNKYLYFSENGENCRIRKVEISSATVSDYYSTTTDYAGYTSARPYNLYSKDKYIYVRTANDIRRLDSYIESNVTNLKYSNVVAVNNSTYNNQLFVFGGEGRGEDKLWRVDTTVNPPTWNDITNMVECPQTFDFYLADSNQGWPHAIADSNGVEASKYGYSFAELWNDKWIIFVHQANNTNYGGVYALDVSRDPPYLYKLTSTQSNSQSSMSQPKYATGNYISEGSATGWERSANPITGCIHKGMLHLSVGQHNDKIFSIDIESTLLEAIWTEIKGATSYDLRRSNDNFVGNDSSIYVGSDFKKTLTGASASPGMTYKIITTVPAVSDEVESAAFTPVHPGYFTGSFTSKVIDTEKNKVKIEFINNIDATSINKDDFEVKVGSSIKTINSSAISNNIITLTLSANITEADGDIQFKYTKHPSNDDRRIYNTVDNKHLDNIDFTQVTNKILPGAVVGLSVTFLNKRANLSWTATAGAEHYIIEQKKGNGNWVQIATNIKITKFAARRLQNKTLYQFRVFAGKPGGLKNDQGATETISDEPTAVKGFNRVFTSLGSGAGSKNEKIDKLVNFTGTDKTTVFSTDNIKAGTGRVKKGSIPADIITAQKELITSATTDSDKRKVRNEVIKLLFSAAEDAQADISSIVLTKEDLAITTSAIKKTDLVVVLPAKERTAITLNLEDYDNDTDLQDKGFYIPIENDESALLNFKGDKHVLFDRQDDESNPNDIKEKIFITQPQGTSTFTNVSRFGFDIDSTTDNYLLPDDVITINDIEIVIGSIGDARDPPSTGGYSLEPDKTQPGIFHQPESVLNNNYSTGGFGGSLGNKKLGSLVDGVGKKKTSYTDYALGSKPTEPYKNWSQPVRNKKLGSMDRLARLKANAIKNSK